MSRLQKDIKKALGFYPLLHLDNKSQYVQVVGEIILTDPEIGEFDRYNVSISILKCYPHCFPKVFELSNKIPKVDYRHVNPDGSLCLAVPPEERLVTKSGINFKFFLDKVLVPHLSRETFRDLNGEYEDGEYAHGNDGIWQFYFKNLGITDKIKIINELEQIVSSNWPSRNESCPCCSKRKFKQCHLNSWQKIKSMGEDYIKNQIVTLKNDIKL